MKKINWDVIFHGHVQKDFYKEKKKLLDETNYHSLKIAYTFTFCFFICLALVAYLYPVVRYTLFVYALLAVVCGLLTVSVYVWLPNHLRFVRLYYRLFECIAFGAGIMAGTYFSPKDLMVQFFLLLIVLPLLYIEKPINSILVSVLASVFFIIASYIVKGNTTNFEIDLLNCVCCLSIGIVFIYYVRDMNLKNIQATILIQHQAELDGLTGILNKAGTEKECQQYLKNYSATQSYALFILDIDNFKKVNDTLGHIQGDELLRRMGAILKEIFSKTDIVGRVGGDEFMVLMKNAYNEESIKVKAEKILEELSLFQQEKFPEKIRCSIGIVFHSNQVTTFQEMYRQADQALYEAKRSGKGCYRFFRSRHF